MKILMTTDTVGGVWHYSIDLACSLFEEQIEVVLVAMGPRPSKAQLAQVKKCRKSGMAFYHQPYKLEWMENPWEDLFRAGEWIKEIYQKVKPDLIHFNNYAPLSQDWEVPTILVGHSCVASWWNAVKKESLPKRFDRYFETVKKAFVSANVVVSPSKALLESYHQIYGRTNNTMVVYNGIANFLPESLPEIYTKRPILFSTGRLWDEAKNIDLLLQAAPYIAGEIYIAGAKEKSFLCPDNVTFLGELSRDQIFNWLKLSSIYVLPVKYEPFGLSFLEAASYKCALIGGNIPSLREIWGNSMTFIDPENPRDLAKSCNELLMQPSECMLKGEEAYLKAKNYTLEKMKGQYLKLYNQVLEKIPQHMNAYV